MLVDVTDFSGGFCDRLRQITFCATLAALEKNHTLVLKEHLTEHCPYLFLDLCEIEGFTIRKWTKKDGHSNFRMGIDDTSYPSLQNVHVHKPATIDLSDEAFLKSWLCSYQKIIPNALVLKRINDLGIGLDCIGFQARTTDKITNQKNHTFDKSKIYKSHMPRINKITRKKIQETLKKSGLSKIFFACDDYKAKTNWLNELEKLNCKIIHNPSNFNPNSFRQTSGEDFAIDLFGLSRCQTLIGTVTSGVTLSAAWISGKNRYYFGCDEKTFPERILIKLRALKGSI